MGKKHGPWTINGSAVKYRHELIEIQEHDVTKPDGQPGKYALARIKPGATVLALDAEGFVFLAKEFRYAVGRETFEAVSGAVDEGEEPAEAARRELHEELGIEAGELISLGRVDPMPSIVDSPSHLFLARELTFKESRQEGGEEIKAVRAPFAEAVRMAHEGEITHGSSCVLILRASKFLSDEERGKV